MLKQHMQVLQQNARQQQQSQELTDDLSSRAKELQALRQDWNTFKVNNERARQVQFLGLALATSFNHVSSIHLKHPTKTS